MKKKTTNEEIRNILKEWIKYDPEWGERKKAYTKIAEKFNRAESTIVKIVKKYGY